MNFSSGGTEVGWIDKYNHLMVDLRDPRYRHYDEKLSLPLGFQGPMPTR